MVEYAGTVGKIPLRYVGSRFSNGRMPLDVLPDLPAFRDLLVAGVKAAWRRDNTTCAGLPSGFGRSFTFDLKGVEVGSATAVIAWNRDLAQDVLPGMTDYLEGLAQRAMMDIVGLVDGSGHEGTPPTLAPDAIRALNRFGCSLRKGERIEFQGAHDEHSDVVYLDAERRKRLITLVEETYDARVGGVGSLCGSSLSGSIEVDTTYGIVEIPIRPAEVEETYDGKVNAMVQFDLTLELDRQDKVRRVRTVHEVDLVDAINATTFAELLRNIDEIGQLEAGWLDGKGQRISPESVLRARSFVLRHIAIAPLMKIYPSIEGGVTIDLRNDRHSGSIDFLPDGTISFTVIGTHEEFELSESYEEIDKEMLETVESLFCPEQQP